MLFAARCVADGALPRPLETAPKAHPELDRYRRAGAARVALYRFPPESAGGDAFFVTRLMEEYSEGVLLEGDAATEFADLRAFVAPPLPGGGSLFRRVPRGPARNVALERLEELFGRAGGADAVRASPLGEAALAYAARLELFAELQASVLASAGKGREAARKAKEQKWAVAEGYEGIERAQMVVVNVRGEEERAGAQRLLEDLVRLRKDAAVFDDVLGWRGHRIPITAVAADLSDPTDAGLKKALLRIGRALRRGGA
jgi:hypothetical protein